MKAMRIHFSISCPRCGVRTGTLHRINSVAFKSDVDGHILAGEECSEVYDQVMGDWLDHFHGCHRSALRAAQKKGGGK